MAALICVIWSPQLFFSGFQISAPVVLLLVLLLLCSRQHLLSSVYFSSIEHFFGLVCHHHRWLRPWAIFILIFLNFFLPFHLMPSTSAASVVFPLAPLLCVIATLIFTANRCDRIRQQAPLICSIFPLFLSSICHSLLVKILLHSFSFSSSMCTSLQLIYPDHCCFDVHIITFAPLATTATSASSLKCIFSVVCFFLSHFQ